MGVFWFCGTGGYALEWNVSGNPSRFLRDTAVSSLDRFMAPHKHLKHSSFHSFFVENLNVFSRRRSSKSCRTPCHWWAVWTRPFVGRLVATPVHPSLHPLPAWRLPWLTCLLSAYLHYLTGAATGTTITFSKRFPRFTRVALPTGERAKQLCED